MQQTHGWCHTNSTYKFNVTSILNGAGTVRTTQRASRGRSLTRRRATPTGLSPSAPLSQYCCMLVDTLKVAGRTGQQQDRVPEPDQGSRLPQRHEERQPLPRRRPELVRCRRHTGRALVLDADAGGVQGRRSTGHRRLHLAARGGEEVRQ